jgi:hypothetical protein
MQVHVILRGINVSSSPIPNNLLNLLDCLQLVNEFSLHNIYCYFSLELSFFLAKRLQYKATPCCTVPHSSVLHCTALHGSVLHYSIADYCTVLHFTAAMRHTELYCTTLHCCNVAH